MVFYFLLQKVLNLILKKPLPSVVIFIHWKVHINVRNQKYFWLITVTTYNNNKVEHKISHKPVLVVVAFIKIGWNTCSSSPNIMHHALLLLFILMFHSPLSRTICFLIAILMVCVNSVTRFLNLGTKMFQIFTEFSYVFQCLEENIHM